MSSIIPKEQLTAYQRWELASFDEPDPPTLEEIQARLERENEEVRQAAYVSGLEEGRAAGFEQGHATGYQQGFAKGQEEGYAQGLQEGRAQGSEEVSRLQQIAQAFNTEIAQASDNMANEVLDLAVHLAKAVLKTALEVRPELVLPIVSDAIHQLPTVRQPARLYLHPADAELTRTLMGEELRQAGWNIVEDTHMDRGGCRIETPTNQIDASINTRWQRISAALGKETGWLE